MNDCISWLSKDNQTLTCEIDWTWTRPELKAIYKTSICLSLSFPYGIKRYNNLKKDKKENPHKNITRSEIQKQNIQAKEVHWKTFGVIATCTQPGLESIWMATGTSSLRHFPATLAEANRAMGERKFHMVLLGSLSVRSAILGMSSHSSYRRAYTSPSFMA